MSELVVSIVICAIFYKYQNINFEQNCVSVMSVELSKSEIVRYSRQLLIPEIGPRGQLSLGRACVLIVGAGGLGCPVATYLTGAGVGHVGIVDYDVIDVSNLHRQVNYVESSSGQSKSRVLAKQLKELNSNIDIEAYHMVLDSSNAIDVIAKYDVIVDCTDNVATRYLLNDACILTNKPLVSGSALRWDGQLTVYNYNGGPCYRCIFPCPPNPETVTNCSDGGVVGPVPGIIGNLQALETIKIITGQTAGYAGKLLLFDGLTGSFKIVKLRTKQPDCDICGLDPKIKGLIDYVQFCGSQPADKTLPSVAVLGERDRVSAVRFKSLVDEGFANGLVLDVRPSLEYEICKLDASFNLPYDDLVKNGLTEGLKVKLEGVKDVFVVCRRGNNSQLAVELLKSLFKSDEVVFKDVVGGLQAYAIEADTNFPVY